MSEIRLYLIVRAPDGEWDVTTHRALQTAKARWKDAVDGDPETAAMAHIGLARPSTRDLKAVLDAHPGRVLLTASARWTVRGIEACSESPVARIDTDSTDEGLPIYLALEGWGYRVDAEELATITPKTRSAFEDWLVDLAADEPDLAADLLEAGAHSEGTYVKCRSGLPHKLRDVVDRYRFKRFAGRIDKKDPIQTLRISPYWLLMRPTAEVHISVRISNVFETQGIRVFGDLLRFDRAAMQEWKNFGRKSISELAKWLYAEAAKLPPEAQQEEEMRAEGSCLRECLENALDALPTRSALILRDRLGAEGKVRKLTDIAGDLNLSRQRVQQLERRHTRGIIASYYWDDLLTEKIATRLSGADSPVYVDLLAAEDPWFRGFEGQHLYLSQVIEAFTEGDFFTFELDGRRIVSRVTGSGWSQIVRDASAYLRETHSPPLSKRQVILALESTAVQGGAPELSKHLYHQLEGRMHFAADPEEVGEVLVGFGRNAEHAARAVLTEATEPLHYTEVAERVRARIGEDIGDQRVHVALGAVGAHLFARGTYGLEQHIGISDGVCEAIKEEAAAIVLAGKGLRQWHCDELCRLIFLRRPALAEELDAYRLNAILQSAPELDSKGRLVWGARDTSSEAPKVPRIQVRDACIEILRTQGGPMSREELIRELSSVRGIGRNQQIHAGGQLARLSPKVWGLIGRDFHVGETELNEILGELATLLADRGKSLHQSEVRRLLAIRGFEVDSALHEEAILGLAEADERFRVSRSRMLRLSSWDADGTVTLRQAVESILSNSPTVGSVVLKHRVEEILRQPVTMDELGDELASLGASLDADGYTWLAPAAAQESSTSDAGAIGGPQRAAVHDASGREK